MRYLSARLVGGVLVFFFVAYALTIALAYTFQREVVFPRRFVNAAPFQLMVGPEFERLTLTTADGESLKAYWKPPEYGAPVVIGFHGNGSLPEPMAVRFGADPWAEKGFGVLTFAYRGYPGSTGTPTEEGLIADGEAAIKFVRARAPSSALVLHGHSLGTGVAVAISERHEGLALVLEAPFSSLPDVVALTMPFLPGQLMHDTFFSQRRIAAAKAQTIIVVHGERDTVVPAILGRRLFSAAPHGVFLSVENADHLNLRGMRDEEIIELVLNGYPQPDPEIATETIEPPPANIPEVGTDPMEAFQPAPASIPQVGTDPLDE